jgi:5-formyltetrahydrofolate cyclo-ligase
MKERQILRQEIRNQRRLLNTQQQNEQAEILCQTLVAQKEVNDSSRIAIYLANDGELDTSPFISWCWKNNIKVYLPVIHPFSKGHLLFLAYAENTKMIRNRYGILEPKLDIRHMVKVSELDIIFTPLVAFDPKGNRLGMGGGFYDRTLSSWQREYLQNKQAKPMPIGLAHDCQLVKSIPAEVWDIPLPKIITPSISYLFDN